MVTRPTLPSRLIEETEPTVTPAIRTGDFGWMLTAVANTAFSRKPCLKGMYFVKPKMPDEDDHDYDHDPEADRVRPVQLGRRDLIVAAPPACEPHFPPAFGLDFDFDFDLGFVLGVARPSAFSVEASYFSLNRFSSRVVSSRSFETLDSGRFPITALPASNVSFPASQTAA